MIYRELTEQEKDYLKEHVDDLKTSYRYYVERGGTRAFTLWLKEELVREVYATSVEIDTSDEALDPIIEELLAEE